MSCLMMILIMRMTTTMITTKTKKPTKTNKKTTINFCIKFFFFFGIAYSYFLNKNSYVLKKKCSSSLHQLFLLYSVFIKGIPCFPANPNKINVHYQVLRGKAAYSKAVLGSAVSRDGSCTTTQWTSLQILDYHWPLTKKVVLAWCTLILGYLLFLIIN